MLTLVSLPRNNKANITVGFLEALLLNQARRKELTLSLHQLQIQMKLAILIFHRRVDIKVCSRYNRKFISVIAFSNLSVQ